MVPFLVQLFQLFQVFLLILSDAVHTDLSTEVSKHQVIDLNTNIISFKFDEVL